MIRFRRKVYEKLLDALGKDIKEFNDIVSNKLVIDKEIKSVADMKSFVSKNDLIIRDRDILKTYNNIKVSPLVRTTTVNERGYSDGDTLKGSYVLQDNLNDGYIYILVNKSLFKRNKKGQINHISDISTKYATIRSPDTSTDTLTRSNYGPILFRVVDDKVYIIFAKEVVIYDLVTGTTENIEIESNINFEGGWGARRTHVYFDKLNKKFIISYGIGEIRIFDIETKAFISTTLSESHVRDMCCIDSRIFVMHSGQEYTAKIKISEFNLELKQIKSTNTGLYRSSGSYDEFSRIFPYKNKLNFIKVYGTKSAQAKGYDSIEGSYSFDISTNTISSSVPKFISGMLFQKTRVQGNMSNLTGDIERYKSRTYYYDSEVIGPWAGESDGTYLGETYYRLDRNLYNLANQTCKYDVFSKKTVLVSYLDNMVIEFIEANGILAERVLKIDDLGGI